MTSRAAAVSAAGATMRNPPCRMFHSLWRTFRWFGVMAPCAMTFRADWQLG
jgi:hypothetical protein